MSEALGIWGVICALTGLGCPEEDLVIVQPVPVTLEVAADGSVTLPSGLVVKEQEVIFEPVGAPTGSVQQVRVRFVAEMLAENQTWPFERIEGDFVQLCANFGMAWRGRSAPNARHIIISIASEPTAFGESVPHVIQFFDNFKVVDNDCIWEG